MGKICKGGESGGATGSKQESPPLSTASHREVCGALHGSLFYCSALLKSERRIAKRKTKTLANERGIGAKGYSPFRRVPWQNVADSLRCADRVKYRQVTVVSIEKGDLFSSLSDERAYQVDEAQSE